MKKTLRMKFMLLLFALVVGCSCVWGQTTATLEIKSSVTSTGDLTDNSNNTWAFNTDGTLTGNNSYIQAGTNKSAVSYITLETSAFSSKKITKVQVWGTSKANTNVSAKVIIGTTTIGTSSVYTSQTASSGGTEYSVDNTNAVAGDLKIEISRPNSSNGAIYFNKAIVTYLEPHTITFNGNGGTYNAATSYTQTVFDGEETNLTTNQFTYADHNFLGWKDANDNEYTDGQSVSLTDDLILTAQWEAIGSDPYITASDVNVTYTATEGSINYTVNNYQSGTMTATKTADWLTIGTITGPDATEHTGTVAFTMNANTGAQRSATVTLSYDYSGGEPATKEVTVTQAVAQYTVTYNKNDNGASGTMTDDDNPYSYNSTVTVLANGFTAPTGKHFYKWNTAHDGSGTYYEKDDTFTITENTTLYAQWRELATYTLVTDADDIVPGKHYIIASAPDANGNAYAMGAQKSNNRYAVPVKVESSVITEPVVDEDDKSGTTLYEFVISGPENISDKKYYTFYDNDVNELNETTLKTGFLQAPGSGNYLRLLGAVTDESRWTIDIDGTSHVATIVSKTTNTQKNMRKNSSSALFACYGNGQNDVYLYKKDIDTDGTIYSATTLSTDQSYTNLTIVKTVANNNPVVNGSITVPNAKTLTVTGTLTNQGDEANIIIENGGQLICSNSVYVKMQKTVTAYSDDTKKGWYAISTPVHTDNNEYVTFTNNATSNIVNIANVTHNVYYLNETIAKWINDQTTGAGFTQLDNGRGYIYRRAEAATLEFKGNTNVEAVSPTLTYTETINSEVNKIKGLNLVGNPFSHNITWGNLSKTNVDDDGCYLLDENPESDDHGKWVTTLKADVTIAPMQAFLLQATNASATLTINKTASSAKAEQYANDNIMFAVSNDKHSDEAYVLFKEGHGLNKVEHRNAEIPMLYVINNDENFGIADMPDNTNVINLGFEAKTMGQYTISLKAEGQYSYMHLIDKLTGNDIDMLVEDSYTFIGSQNDRKDRFVLRLNYNAAGIDTESDIFAYQNGNDILVSGEGTLQVFDITGRKVMTMEVNGVETVNGLANGVYVFRMNEKTQKIVVR